MPGDRRHQASRTCWAKPLAANGVKRKVKVQALGQPALAEEAEKLLDRLSLPHEAIDLVENNGIAFIDEIDKVANHEVVRHRCHAQGVQRDSCPLIEGTHRFVRSTAVEDRPHPLLSPRRLSRREALDLLPGAPGPVLPIRVDSKALDTRRSVSCILSDTDASLISRYIALMKTEGASSRSPTTRSMRLPTPPCGSTRRSKTSALAASTVMERLVEEISFDAPDHKGTTINIDAAYVKGKIDSLAADRDLSRFVL